jgi:hypothetical protein
MNNLSTYVFPLLLLFSNGIIFSHINTKKIDALKHINEKTLNSKSSPAIRVKPIDHREEFLQQKVTKKQYYRDIAAQVAVGLGTYIAIKYLMIRVVFASNHMKNPQYEEATLGFLIPTEEDSVKTKMRLKSINKSLNKGENFELIQALIKNDMDNHIFFDKAQEYKKLFHIHLVHHLKKNGWNQEVHPKLTVKIQRNQKPSSYVININKKDFTVTGGGMSEESRKELLLIPAILALKYVNSYTGDIHRIFDSMAKTILKFNNKTYVIPNLNTLKNASWKKKIKGSLHQEGAVILETINPLRILTIY